MVTSVAMHPDAWMDGVQVNAQDLRLQAVSAHLTGASPSGSTGIAARPGVRYGTGSPLLVAAASGMNVTVNAGVAFVQGSTSATAGMYTGCLDTTATLTVTTSDPTNPRIDNVIVQVTDVGTSSSTTVVTLQAGTPAPSPVAPTLPANSLLLATIAVGAAVSSIVAGNIADGRVYTASVGGIVAMKDVTGGITGPAGLYVQDLSTGRLKVADGAGNARQPKVAAFAPVTTTVTSSVSVPSAGTWTVLASASITTDGATEIMATGTWQGIGGTGGSAAYTNIGFLIDGVSFGSNTGWTNGTGGYTTVSGGGTTMGWITPAAGAHTVQMVAYSHPTVNLSVYAASSSPIILRVAAAPA
jgi:hypothetical protein